MQAVKENLTVKQFNDPTFPKLTIKQFTAMQLQIDEEKVLDVLVQALALEKQTPENRQLLEKALAYTVNASGAVILMVNTNEGLQLVYGNSQRRKKVITSNGACEANESMADTATREFQEEFGNPAEKGILCSTVRNPRHCRALEVTNKIGTTAAEIANRIIDLKADKGRLYINIAALYVNEGSVNIRALQREIDDLNETLQRSALYYTLAVKLVFGAGINLADHKLEAQRIINEFKSNCCNITYNFVGLFASHYDETTDTAKMKEALLAIIDLTENDALGLLPKSELESLLNLDLSKKENLDALKKEFFAPSFENLVAHKGKHTASEFLSGLEKLASQTSQVTLGLPGAALTTQAEVTESLLNGPSK